MLTAGLLVLLMLSDIKEIVYQAEVYGRVEAGLETLRDLLARAQDADERRDVIRAMGVIKHPKGPTAIRREGLGLDEVLQKPRGLLHFQGISYLLVGGTWLEPGDWLEDYFVQHIDSSRLVLERLDGNLRPLQLSNLGPAPQTDEPGYLILAGASLRDVLTFVAERAGLNVFLGPTINGAVTGSWSINSWLILLDEICSVNQISFTRNGESIIFVLRDTRLRKPGKVVPARGRQVQDLHSFLRDLADSVGLELDFDGDLGAEMVESRYENVPWDQVLECVAISNNFTWFLEPFGERRRLVVQKYDARD
ncbi:MAG: hypothetical protein QNK37_29095 [Acidobacteriota bacterium]|nr:hypothetical protein [Acidobacteriota bacterium]